MSALAHPVSWQAPRPLWRGTTRFAAAPQILRFASDDFMEQLVATLEEEPARLSDRIAKPETWRDPPQGVDLVDPIVRLPLPAPIKDAKRRQRWGSAPSAPPAPVPANKPLKLYQPAHQRYYVVAGTLACAIPGLPERTLGGAHEQVGFVLRRLLPADVVPADTQDLVEFAYVKEGDEARWQRVEGGGDLAPGEEMLPLFPLPHRDENGAARTIWGGLIPVARREEYIGKPVVTTAVSLTTGQLATLRPAAPPPRPNTTVARTAQLRIEVSEPWKAMVRAAIKAGDEFEVKSPNPADPVLARARRVLNYNFQFQMQSWLLLVDLRHWIDLRIPALGGALTANSPDDLSPQEGAVWNFLAAAKATALDGTMGVGAKPMASSMLDALQRIPPFEAKLDAATTHYSFDTRTAADWPDFHFPLAGLKLPVSPVAKAVADGPYKAATTAVPPLDPVGTTLDPPGATAEQAKGIKTPTDSAGTADDVASVEALDRFTALLARALPPDDEAKAQPIPHAMKLRDVMIKTAGDQGLFAIRMVHLNADCGPLHPPTLSAPSERFRLASFFDYEAPLRPITITLPSDTTPAGLRKYGRGTAFVMSDLLCGQVQRAKGLGFIDLVLQVLPWPFHKDIDTKDGGGCKNNGLDIGMICSLSIPIITLCALILLIIIVTLLDLIFRWLPWFIACFPVPKLKGNASP